jgi:hypothetical protein
MISRGDGLFWFVSRRLVYPVNRPLALYTASKTDRSPSSSRPRHMHAENIPRESPPSITSATR